MTNLQAEIDSIVREATYRISNLTNSNSLTWDDVDKINDEASKAILQLFDKSVGQVIGRGRHAEKKHLSGNQYIEQEAENKLIKKQRQTWNKIKSGEEKV